LSRPLLLTPLGPVSVTKRHRVFPFPPPSMFGGCRFPPLLFSFFLFLREVLLKWFAEHRDWNATSLFSLCQARREDNRLSFSFFSLLFQLGLVFKPLFRSRTGRRFPFPPSFTFVLFSFDQSNGLEGRRSPLFFRGESSSSVPLFGPFCCRLQALHPFLPLLPRTALLSFFFTCRKTLFESVSHQGLETWRLFFFPLFIHVLEKASFFFFYSPRSLRSREWRAVLPLSSPLRHTTNSSIPSDVFFCHEDQQGSRTAFRSFFVDMGLPPFPLTPSPPRSLFPPSFFFLANRCPRCRVFPSTGISFFFPPSFLGKGFLFLFS